MSRKLTVILLIITMVILVIAPQSGAIGEEQSDRGKYTVETTLRHNPQITGADIDNYIWSVYPNSPMVGLGQVWVKVGAKYNIDPVYLMAHAILESGWGFSWISQNKKNLYGWGAYDRDPEGMAESSNSYADNIDYVASNINTMYLTPGGDYYTEYGPTLQGMNVHYASSKTWAQSIADIMNEFASRISGYIYPGTYRDYDAAYKAIDIQEKMYAGQPNTVAIYVRNRGQKVWPKDSPFKLYYQFVGTQGNDQYVAGTAMPEDVPPKGEALLLFQVTPPITPGIYNLRFDMVNEGVTAFSTTGVHTLDKTVRVENADPLCNAALNGSGITENAMYAGTSYRIEPEVTNKSSMVWPAGKVKAGYWWINIDSGAIAISDQQAGILETDIAPGQTVRFNADLRTPSLPGRYILKQDMVGKGSWFSTLGAPTNSTYVEIMPDFGASYKILEDYEPVYVSTPKIINVNITNTSRMMWPQNGLVQLSYTFDDKGAHDGYTQRIRMPQDVSPGENITIPVTVDPPSIPGTYDLKLDLYYETIGWFSSKDVKIFSVPVHVISDYKASYTDVAIGDLVAGYPGEAKIRLTNTSEMVWPANGRIKLAYSFTDKGDHSGYSDGIALPETVKPGDQVLLTVPLTSPSVAGVYTLRFDLKDDGYTWFSKYGVPMPGKAVVVDNPYGAEYTDLAVFPVLTAGKQIDLSVRVKNTGKIDWPGEGWIKLGYGFFTYGVPGEYTAVVPIRDKVIVGGSELLTLTVKTPEKPGNYTLKLDLIDGDKVWFHDTGADTAAIDVEIKSD